jgi:hypothetical protein
VRRGRKFADLSAENGVLVYSSSYESALVAALKMAIPASDRRWDPERKVWTVLPRHAQTLVDLSAQYLGVMVMAPNMSASVAQTETRLLDVRYIGATKERAPGEERSAFGHSGGEWSVLFPESVLLAWFGACPQGDEHHNHALRGARRDRAAPRPRCAPRIAAWPASGIRTCATSQTRRSGSCASSRPTRC